MTKFLGLLAALLCGFVHAQEVSQPVVTEVSQPVVTEVSQPVVTTQDEPPSFTESVESAVDEAPQVELNTAEVEQPKMPLPPPEPTLVPQAPAPTLLSRAVIVQEEETHQVIYSLNSDEARPIASITKLMAMWVVHGMNLPPEEKVKVVRDQKYLYAKGMYTRLRAGEVKTRAELLERALVTSDNLAAYSVSRAVPGGVEEVVRLMNQRAVELGMTDTEFVEPTGMMIANRSTAEDLAKLVAAASADLSFRELASKQFTEHTKKSHPNTNPLLVTKPELVDTSKTGFIKAAGKCVVSRLFVNGRRYLVVLLQAPSTVGIMHDYAALYSWLGGTDTITVPRYRPAVSSKVNKKSRRTR